MKLSSVLLACVLLTLPGSVRAQSLGDLAKKEQARRKAAPPAAKTYTNDDLKKQPPMADTVSPPAEKPTKVDDAVKPADAKADAPAAPAAPDGGKDEKYWRGRLSAAREEIRRNEMFREALQTRINALSADFSSRDDPFQRGKIADDRQKALAELARVSLEIERSTKQIADIEEEARRAGVPPGWLR
ncbi:MAG: hypothetical protein ABIQ52_13035 [Vicinamibacterales bacterium]